MYSYDSNLNIMYNSCDSNSNNNSLSSIWN